MTAEVAELQTQLSALRAQEEYLRKQVDGRNLAVAVAHLRLPFSLVLV